MTVDDAAQPDLECSIQALSQLLLGASELPRLLANREDIVLRTDRPDLLKAFPTNPMFLVEDF